MPTALAPSAVSVTGEGHGAEYGQGSVLPCGEQPGLELEQVGKCFEHDEVRAVLLACDHCFAEQLVGLVKRERTHGFEHFAERTEIQRDFDVVPPLGGGRRLCVSERRAHELVNRVIAAAQLVPVYAERVRINIIGAGADIGAVNIRQDIRMGDIDRFRQRRRHVDSACEHGAHASVKQKAAVFHLQFILSVFFYCIGFTHENQQKITGSHPGTSPPEGSLAVIINNKNISILTSCSLHNAESSS